jgi:hypothetical protein
MSRICKVNNAREVIPAALGRSLKTNVYFLTIVRLSTGYCYIRYLIGRFWRLILDTFKNSYSSLNAALSVNIARKCTGRISKFNIQICTISPLEFTQDASLVPRELSP